MKAKIARWGNSLAVRLPVEVVRAFGLDDGQVVEITPNSPKIEIEPVRAGRRTVNGVPVYTLQELVEEARRLGPGAEPETLEWGPDRGSEVIDDEYSRGEITLEDLPRRNAP